MPFAIPTLYVVAGPNGCGKSTLTRIIRFSGTEVIDPDAIARDMVSGTLGQAGREALRRRHAALGAGRMHLVETTLAGFGALRHIEAARTNGYRIELYYVCVDSPDLALDRIQTRVASGGHDVSEQEVRRRFARSLDNLPAAIARSDLVRLYDNTNPDEPHFEVAARSGSAWWIAEFLPDWTIAAFAGMTLSFP